MQMHLSTLFNEEENQSIIITSFYNYSVQILLEVMSIISTINPNLLQGDIVHLFNDSLATWFIPTVVEETDCMGCISVD